MDSKKQELMKKSLMNLLQRFKTMRVFIVYIATLFILALHACSPSEQEKPNIILIMADDMGFSDIGAYGGEISTPNLDRLAANGVKFTQFHNGARCCPSRASLLTGLYAQQTGIGYMVDGDWGHPSYTGDLNNQCMTIAEVLNDAGYATHMSGKWHLTRHIGHFTDNEELASKHNWPLQRGFDSFFGTITGAGSYYDPVTLVKGNDPVEPYEDFYYTDAINDNTVSFINEHVREETDQPFFAYVAHVAPHWPLHALNEDIEKYKGYYDKGWDHIRETRLARMKKLGLIDDHQELSARDPRVSSWEDEEHQEWRIRAMEVYAAQIDIMDQGIGRIIEALDSNKILDNTLIVFLSDNGGCAEVLTESWRGIWRPRETHDGEPVHWGNIPGLMPGQEETYQSYDAGWANASNTPFRLFKHYAHAGGTSTPLIMHWPDGIRFRDEWRHYPSHLIDLMPTFLEISGISYPDQFNGEDIEPLEGRSLMPYINKDLAEREDPLFWEHGGNRAVRDGKWKLVQRHNNDWELYNLHIEKLLLRSLFFFCVRNPFLLFPAILFY